MDIKSLSFKDRSLMFADLSKIAYCNKRDATSQAKNHNFTTRKKHAASLYYNTAPSLYLRCAHQMIINNDSYEMEDTIHPSVYIS